MRTFLGLLVLIAGLGGLGYWAMTTHAARIEAEIMDTAAALDGPGLTIVVSGRDVTVAGVVQDAEALSTLRRQLEQIDGVREVRLVDVSLLPVASPFEIRLSLSDSGLLQAEGVLPSDEVRAAFDSVMGNPLDGLPLAAGAPDEAWGDVLIQTAEAVPLIEGGAAVLSDQTLTLSGQVRLPEDHAAVIDALGPLPEGYVLVDEIDVLDDGTPFRLTASVQDGAVTALGKVPATLNDAAILDFFDRGDAALDAARIAPPDGWQDVALAGAEALSALIEGELALEGQALMLTGSGSPDGIAEAQATLDALTVAGYDITTDLSLFGADIPQILTMEWDGQVATASGTYPAGFTPRGPQGDAVADTGEALFVPDTDGAFRQNADAGVAALGLLDRGILTVTRAQITLAGTAPSPQVGRTINTVLEGAADGTLTDLEITYLDDGSPAAFTLAYDAATGARVEGRLPTSLDVDDLASALRLPSVGGTPATALEDAEAGATAEILSVAASLLPEIETLTYARADGASALDMVLSPGANLDLIAADLSERLPGDVVFSVGPLDTPPPDGASRTNAATGLDQLAQNGFWLPATAFDPDKATCTTQTDAVLARNKVSFLPSSADLDATANRALDALTAVILACTDADLTLEVVGHTDTSGNAFDNEALSLERAEVVLEELIARGVPEAAMTAFGVGGSEPIATNDTAEGRAANRRTEIIWFAPGDLREP